MHTDDLIKTLAADARPQALSLQAVWWAAAAAAVALASLAFLAVLGPRPDFAEALGTVRFPFKFVVTLLLVGSAFALARELSRPDGAWSRRALALAAAPAVLLAAVAMELVTVPVHMWSDYLVGANMAKCLLAIPLMGMAPLAGFLLALRHGAPARPGLAGAVAGLLAGGISATFYAAHCPDDSPLFVAAWYTLAIASLAILGAAAARRLARW